MQKKLIALVLAGLFALSVFALPSLIDGGAVQATEPPRHHKHFITLKSGKVVEVGPNVCDVPMNDAGWHKFHSQMHRGIPGDVLDISIEFCE